MSGEARTTAVDVRPIADAGPVDPRLSARMVTTLQVAARVAESGHTLLMVRDRTVDALERRGLLATDGITRAGLAAIGRLRATPTDAERTAAVTRLEVGEA